MSTVDNLPLQNNDFSVTVTSEDGASHTMIFSPSFEPSPPEMLAFARAFYEIAIGNKVKGTIQLRYQMKEFPANIIIDTEFNFL